MATTTQTKHSKRDPVQINQGLTIIHPNPDEARKSSNDDNSVDIIAVPGLGANPEWTWKSKTKVDWLRDKNMLVDTIKDARLMVYEYESQWFGKGSVNQRLSNVANGLIHALFHRRPKASRRPIIFIGHSMGGIIVEQAILTAKISQSEYPNIFTSVVGCIFLGAPFRGTKSQEKASRLADLAEKVGHGTSSGLIKLLSEDSEDLRNLLDSFVGLAKEASMRLFCFFEMHESNLVKLVHKKIPIKHMEMIVDERSATFDGWGKLPLAANHFELNKFDGPKDGRYISVAGEIRTMVQKAGGILRLRRNANRQALIDDGKYQMILDELKVTDPVKDKKTSIGDGDRSLDQAKWVLNNQNYIKWKESKVKDASQVLWIHGKAGQGQELIASLLVDDLARETENKDGRFLGYFFCDQNDPHRRNTLDVLKLLIRQMISRRPELMEHLLVDQRQGKNGKHNSRYFDETTISALWNSLQRMLKDCSIEKAYLVVNALNETDGDSRKEFLSLLKPSLEKQQGDENDSDESTVKWIFLSKSGRPDIETAFRQALIIDMQGEGNISHVNDAVKAEISAQVDELAKEKNYNPALAYLIKKYIHSRAEGDYIYVNLVVQELRNLEGTRTSNSSIRKILEEFPYGLTDIFKHICHRVLDPKSEGFEYTKEIFRCLIRARRPLTIYELALIADLPLEDRDNKVALKRYIAQCGAFVKISKADDETVEWIALAAKEHLESYAKDQLSLWPTEVQHGIIALRCLDYLRNNASVDEEIDHNAPSQEQQEADHQSITAENQDESRLRVEEIPGESSNQVENGNWQREDHQSLVHQASDYYTGQHQQEFQSSVSKDQYYDGPDHRSWDHATQNYPSKNHHSQSHLSQDYPGHDYPAQAYPSLTYAYSPQNHPPQDYPIQGEPARDYQTPYQNVTYNHQGQEGQTQEHYRDNDVETHEGENLDGQAQEPPERGDSDETGPTEDQQQAGAIGDVGGIAPSEKAHETRGILEYPGEYWLEHARLATDIVEEFDLDDDFWTERSPSRTAWWSTYAESNGYDDLTDVTSLHIAAFFAFDALVDHLLKHGRTDELYKSDSWGYQPLHWACRKDDISLVERLLKAGADVNAPLRDQKITPIWFAAWEGREVVQYLLDQGAKIDVQDQDFGTPLYAAAEHGCIPVVRQLLNHGANVNLTGGLHRRPINAAAYYGRIEVVQLLLQKGAEVDPEEDYRYGSALGAAARKGHDAVVRLLLQSGWNVNRKSGVYNGALVAAATYGHVQVVQALLERDPDVTSREQALEKASKNGRTDVVKILLEQSHYLRHRQAFLHAASYGHDDILRLLQRLGTDQDMLSMALYDASDHEHESTVRTLLTEFGADPNAEGEEYGTALTAAAYDGTNGIVQILLDNGADVNKQGGVYGNALQAAAYCGRVEVVQKLLDHGAYAITAGIGRYGSALQAACYSGSEEIVELLLKHGADVNAEGGEYGYPIIAAADESDQRILEILLRNGADANVKGGEDNATALILAGYGLPKETMKLLLDHGAEIDATDDDGTTALISTAASRDMEGLELLLNHGAEIHACGNFYGTALHAAASEGFEECCEFLLKNGADVNQQGGRWLTALQAAAWVEDLDCINVLLNAGADVNLGGGEYGSALQAAAYSGNLDCLQAILKAGADVNQEGGEYGYALQAAASPGRVESLQAAASRHQNVKLLLDHGADALKSGGRYGSVMQAAAVGDNLSLWDILMAHGSDIHAVGGKYGTVLQAAALKAEDNFVRRLLEHSVEVNMVGGKYGTALQAAAYANKAEVLTMLLEHGADVHIQGGLYGTALNAAARKGNTNIVSLLLDRSLPDRMLDDGLLQAVYHREAGVVDMLLKNGANVQAGDQVFGSVWEALQTQIQDDGNSDDAAEDYEEEDSEDEDAENDINGGDDDEGDAQTEGQKDDPSIVSSQAPEDQSKKESKISKLLEDAMTKVKQNPSIQRFRSVRRKAVPRHQDGGQTAEPSSDNQTHYSNAGQVAQPPESYDTPYDNSYQAPNPADPGHYGYQQHSGHPQEYQAYPDTGYHPHDSVSSNSNQYANAGQAPDVGPPAGHYQDYDNNGQVPEFQDPHDYHQPDNTQYQVAPGHSDTGYNPASDGHSPYQHPNAGHSQTADSTYNDRPSYNTADQNVESTDFARPQASSSKFSKFAKFWK
ncbi:MAG: hypothetical protein M1816_001207 [Peltula sp. TS41687]|nr:MAG: hypothetical protein M1816_001207 [Peltula sp. TS41687]